MRCDNLLQPNSNRRASLVSTVLGYCFNKTEVFDASPDIVLAIILWNLTNHYPNQPESFNILRNLIQAQPYSPYCEEKALSHRGGMQIKWSVANVNHDLF